MKRNEGFTLIEVIATIAVISILSSMVIVSLNRARMVARDAQRLADVQQVMMALEQYKRDHGAYPDHTWSSNSSWTNWVQCWFADAGRCNYAGTVRGPSLSAMLQPYIDPLPVDPLGPGWLVGASYVYHRADPGDPGGWGYTILVRMETSGRVGDGRCRVGVNMHPCWWSDAMDPTGACVNPVPDCF